MGSFIFYGGHVVRPMNLGSDWSEYGFQSISSNQWSINQGINFALPVVLEARNRRRLRFISMWTRFIRQPIESQRRVSNGIITRLFLLPDLLDEWKGLRVRNNRFVAEINHRRPTFSKVKTAPVLFTSQQRADIVSSLIYELLFHHYYDQKHILYTFQTAFSVKFKLFDFNWISVGFMSGFPFVSAISVQFRSAPVETG